VYFFSYLGGLDSEANNRDSSTMQWLDIDNYAIMNFINEIAPNHSRPVCSDADSAGNEKPNELGYPKCPRCALLYRLKTGIFPNGAMVDHLVIKFRR
jgi:hypothetical protein